jgi:hypothetical protein
MSVGANLVFAQTGTNRWKRKETGKKETGDGKKGDGKGEWKVNIRRGEPCVRPNRNEQMEKKGDGRKGDGRREKRRRAAGEKETGGGTHFSEINRRDGWRTVAICP